MVPERDSGACLEKGSGRPRLDLQRTDHLGGILTCHLQDCPREWPVLIDEHKRIRGEKTTRGDGRDHRGDEHRRQGIYRGILQGQLWRFAGAGPGYLQACL
ncbi:MAG TPA: hypothetical protein VKN82_07325 [Desulfohalobiaceae bacterium]|nr:hypothetical protein [Desulfohalobiaceae bacterium]